MAIPKVSVLVAFYNVEKYFERCLDSLFNQSLKEIEFIFIDDGSTDKSFNILTEKLKEYPERKTLAKIIRHETNQGITKTRSEGLNLATGKYFTICDGDDWVDHDMYETLFNLGENENADLVGCNIIEEYGENAREPIEKFVRELTGN